MAGCSLLGESAQHHRWWTRDRGTVPDSSAGEGISVTAWQLIEAVYGWLVKPSGDDILVAFDGPDERSIVGSPRAKSVFPTFDRFLMLLLVSTMFREHDPDPRSPPPGT